MVSRTIDKLEVVLHVFSLYLDTYIGVGGVFNSEYRCMGMVGV